VLILSVIDIECFVINFDNAMLMHCTVVEQPPSSKSAAPKVVKLSTAMYDNALRTALRPLVPDALSSTDDTTATAAATASSASTQQQRKSHFVVRDKNIANDQLWRALQCTRAHNNAVAIAYGSSERDFSGLNEDPEHAARVLGSIDPLTPWEIAVCMRRVLMRDAHPTIDGQSPGMHAATAVYHYFVYQYEMLQRLRLHV
jgi:hypothetical protein